MEGGRRGFNLVEMVVVIAIIAILLAIVMPLFSGLRSQASAVTCAANRRSLLEAVELKAVQDDQDMATAFAQLYGQADVKSGYVCPDGGTYSWQDGRIVCSRHDGSSGTAAGGYVVTLSPDVDDVQRSKGEVMDVVKGRIYHVGDSYYVGVDNYGGIKVANDYAAWMAGSYYFKKVDFSRSYTDADLGTDGLINNYAKISGIATAGAVYKHAGRLYVQTQRFAGNVSKLSSDPDVTTNYWTLLGTIQ